MKNIYESNRKAWNQAILYHKKNRKFDLVELINKNKILDSIELSMLDMFDLSHKSVCQLCCNNGRELISINKIYNTSHCAGFDISDEAIKDAKKLNDIFDTKIDFVRCNVFDIDNSYYNKFDYIYITVGSLNWIENLKNFFEIANKLLKETGVLLIYELYPITKIFPSLNDSNFLKGNGVEIKYDYFDRSIDKYFNGIDYVGKTQYESSEICEYKHTLSDIINSIINNHFKIIKFDEYKEDISSVYEHLEKLNKLPLSYTLIAKKDENYAKKL